jgi:hypothetical protein
MKMLIVTCIKEDQEAVYKIFRKATISAYSSTNVTGFKDGKSPDLLGEWFATGDERFDSICIFSFTTEENTDQALNLIKQHNIETGTHFPIRGFVISVEKSSF